MARGRTDLLLRLGVLGSLLQISGFLVGSTWGVEGVAAPGPVNEVDRIGSHSCLERIRDGNRPMLAPGDDDPLRSQVPERQGLANGVGLAEGAGGGLIVGPDVPLRSGTETVPPCRKCSYQAMTRFM